MARSRRAPVLPRRIWFLIYLLLGCANLPVELPAQSQTGQPVSTIDVLVLYTPQAQKGAGGASALLNQINLAMVEANMVLQNSRVNARFHLALAAGINYQESGSVSNDLARLRNPQDRVFSLAHQLRDRYHADLVCLITETGNDWWFYGLQGPSAENACSIIRRPYLTGSYFLPVTLSFNFGCQLDRPDADSVGAFPYAYGYSFWADDGNYYSTVESFSGQRIRYFSNPDILVGGSPAGVPPGTVGEADNALVMNQTAPLVAGFRAPAPTTKPPIVKIASPANGSQFRAGSNIVLNAVASDPDGSVVRVDYYATSASNQITWLGSSASAKSKYAALGFKVPAGQYSVFAVATDNQNATTTSDPAIIAVRPANDNFANRTPLTGTSQKVTADNTWATVEPGEPNDGSGAPVHNSLWWSYTPSADGVINLQMLDSTFSPYVSVFTGNSLATLVTVGATFDPFDYPLRIPVSAGIAYQIAIDNSIGLAGPFTFDFNFNRAPANDDFSRRQRLAGDHVLVHANNLGASAEPGEPDHAGSPAAASLWWSWTAPASGQLDIDATNEQGQELLVGVYTGDVLTNLMDASPEYNYPSGYSLIVQAGITYQIAVDSPVDFYSGNPRDLGPFGLSLNFTAAATNDVFASRTPIFGPSISVTNTTFDPTNEIGSPATSWPAWWWSWKAPASGFVTVTCPFGQYVDVFTGTEITNLTRVGSGYFLAIAGTTYDIAASGWPYTVEFNLALSPLILVAPTNNAQSIFGQPIVLEAVDTGIDGHPSPVEFLDYGVPIGSVSHPPFRFVWRNAPAGYHYVIARRTNKSGAIVTSQPVLVNVSSPLPPPPPPPSNDNFANRTAIQGTWIDVTNSNVGATLEPGEPCPMGADYWWTCQNSIWWTWTAPTSGDATISSFSGHMIGVYTGSSVSNLAAIASGREADFVATAGTTYDITANGPPGDVALELVVSNLRITDPTNGAVIVAGNNIPVVAAVGSTEQPVNQIEFYGDGNLLGTVSKPPYTVSWTNVVPGTHHLYAVATDAQGHARRSPSVSVRAQPSNSDFANATVLTGENVQTNGTTLDSGGDSGEQTVWYSWTAPDSGRYTALASSGSAVAVFTGQSFLELAEVPENPSDTSAFSGSATFSSVAGTKYYISISSQQAPGTGFTLGILKAPVNDDFASRITITNVNTAIAGNNRGASVEPGEPNSGYYYGGESVWWSWTPPQSGVVVFVPDVYFSGGWSLQIYAGSSVSNLNSVPYEFEPSEWFNNPVYEVTAGTNYYIAATGLWNSDWSIAFTMSFTARPANDEFADATVLTGTNPVVSGTDFLATFESGEPNPQALLQPWDPQEEPSVWYSWTAPVTGRVTLTAGGANFIPVVGVYTGTVVSNLSLVTAGNSSTTTFPATAGTTYKVAVDGNGGGFTLGLSVTVAPANDSFASRVALSGFDASTNGTTLLSTLEPGEVALNPFSNPVGSVWYSWIAPASGLASISWSDPVMVFTGDAITNLTPVAPIAQDLSVYPVVSGTEYEIEVLEFEGGSAPFTLSIDLSKVQIISPTYGTAIPGPVDLSIVATNIDSDCAAKSVGFYEGSTLLGTLTNAPFTFVWHQVPPGQYLISAQSTDVCDQTNTSVPIELDIVPPNDDFENRVVLEGTNVTIATDNSGATVQPGEVVPPYATGKTLWWTWTAPADGDLTIVPAPFSTSGLAIRAFGRLANSNQISLMQAAGREIPQEVIIGGGGSGPSPLISVYTGTEITNLTVCASNGNQPGYWGSVNSPRLVVSVNGGQTYQISMDGTYGYCGSTTLNFSYTRPPPNDDFADRIVLFGSSPGTNGTTQAATREAGEPDHGVDLEARTVWYSWTAQGNGDAQVSIEDWDVGDPLSGPPLMAIGVYAGSQIDRLIPISLGTDGASFFALAGTTYQIAVASPDNLEANFVLWLDTPPAPPSINSTNTHRLSNGSYNVEVTGVIGQSFVVQTSPDGHTWKTILTDTLLGTTFDFNDTSTKGARVYRVVPLDAIDNSQPLAIRSASMQGASGFSITLSGTPGQPFRLQASTNLVDWDDITSGPFPAQGFQFTDGQAADFDHRYYRPTGP